MCDVIDIRGEIHEANVRRIAKRVLNIISVNPRGKDLVVAIQFKIPELNNWFLVSYIINRCFPYPTLTKVQNPSVIEDVVIEELVSEGFTINLENVAKS